MRKTIKETIVCLIVTLVMAYFSIANLMAGNLTAGILQGVIALFFLLLLARNIYVTVQERKGCSVGGCRITESLARLFGRGKE
jgi:predicted neutral ceramidase superfamily lipid hydrolase